MHNSYTPSSLHTSLKYSMYLLGVIFRYPLCASQLFILICCAGVPSVFFQTSKARPLLRYSSLDPATLPLAVISHPRNRKAYAGAQVWQLILYGVSRFYRNRCSSGICFPFYRGIFLWNPKYTLPHCLGICILFVRLIHIHRFSFLILRAFSISRLFRAMAIFSSPVR